MTCSARRAEPKPRTRSDRLNQATPTPEPDRAHRGQDLQLAWRVRCSLRCVRYALGLGFVLAVSSARAQPEAAPDPYLHEVLDAELASGTYAFCTGQNYRLWQEDKDSLCDKTDKLSALCPGLSAACKRASWEDVFAEREAEQAPSWTKWLPRIGELGASLIQVTFWLTLGAGLLLVLRILLKNLSRRVKLEDDTPRRPHEAPATIELIPSQSPQELLVLARQESADGQHHRALHLAYAALVRHLILRYRLRARASTTSREYLRELTQLSDSGAERDALIDLDRHRFQRQLDADTTRTLIRLVTKVIQRLPHAATLLLCLLVTSCKDPELPQAPHDPSAPRGLSLFEALLEEQATSLTRRIRPVTDLPESTSTVIAVGASLRPLEWATLRDFVERGGHLVVSGIPAGFGEAFGLSLETAACSKPPSYAGLDVVPVRVLDGMRGLSGDIMLSSCESVPFAAARFHGRGLLTLIGDSGLLENGSLLYAHNVDFVFELLGDLSGHVELLGPLTGQGAQNPLESVLRAGLGPWLAHLLLLLGLYGWARGRRFGPAHDPPEKKRRSFSEHAAALAATYQKREALGAALQHYAWLTTQLLKRRSASLSEDERSLTHGLGLSDTQSAELRRALGLAKNAGQLGAGPRELIDSFRRLQLINHRARRHRGAMGMAMTDTQTRRRTLRPGAESERKV